MVTVEVAPGRRAVLVVKESGTPMIGISGHAILSLDRAAPVLVHGELGPYTIVSYEGRNGYVLSDSLADEEASRSESQGYSKAAGASDTLPASNRLLAVLCALLTVGFLAAGVFVALL